MMDGLFMGSGVKVVPWMGYSWKSGVKVVP